MRKLLFPALMSLTLIGCSQRSNEPEVVKETYIHRYGVEVTPQDWTQRGRSGQVISKLRNGVTVTRSYKDGQFDGVTTFTFPHSELIARTEEYTSGSLKKEIDHYPSGQPRIETIYRGEGNRSVNHWYDHGKILAKEIYRGEALIKGEYFKKDGQIESSVDNGHGERVARDDYGNLISRDAFSEGYLVTVTTYHPNGTPKEITPYVRNVVEGAKRSFLPDGEPITIETWQGGVQEGLTVLFQNGEKIAEIPYHNGIKSGVEKRFAGGKRVVEEITWVSGTKHGPYNTLVGDKIQTDWYHRGKRVSKNTFETMEKKTV